MASAILEVDGKEIAGAHQLDVIHLVRIAFAVIQGNPFFHDVVIPFISVECEAWESINEPT